MKNINKSIQKKICYNVKTSTVVKIPIKEYRQNRHIYCSVPQFSFVI